MRKREKAEDIVLEFNSYSCFLVISGILQVRLTREAPNTSCEAMGRTTLQT